MNDRPAPEPAPEPDSEPVADPSRGIAQPKTAFAQGAVGGMIAGVVIAWFLGDIPADDEQRLQVSAVAFVAMVGSSAAVAAFSLLWLVLRRSPGAAIALGFSLLLPATAITAGLLLWR